MSITFPCPECGHQLKAGEELANKRVQCALRKRPILVPGATAGPHQRPSAETEPEHRPPARGQSLDEPPHKQGRLPWLLAGSARVGLILVAILLLVAVASLVIVSRSGRGDKLAPNPSASEQQTKETGKSIGTNQVKPARPNSGHALEPVVNKPEADQAVNKVNPPDPNLEQSKLGQKDDQAWANAGLANSPEAFNAYLLDYPTGKHAPEARQATEAWQWVGAQRAL